MQGKNSYGTEAETYEDEASAHPVHSDLPLEAVQDRPVYCPDTADQKTRRAAGRLDCWIGCKHKRTLGDEVGPELPVHAQ